MAKKPLSIKQAKYIKAVATGMPKIKALAVAGYSPNTLPSTVDNTEAVKNMSVKDSILSHITLAKITELHVENITQADDRNVRNAAIKLAYERIEPDTDTLQDNDIVMVNIKG